MTSIKIFYSLVLGILFSTKILAECTSSMEDEYNEMKGAIYVSYPFKDTQAIINRLEKMAQCGVMAAAAELGAIYTNGRLVEANYNVALSYVELAYSYLDEGDRSYRLDFLYSLLLMLRYKSTGNEELLNESISLLKELYDAEYSERSTYMYGVALTSNERSRNKGLDIIDKLAKKGYQKAVDYLNKNRNLIMTWREKSSQDQNL
ncbi:hypothetical protein ACFOEK_18360 [Litoribrevibacter euphylliae]|uniref:Sel1 repeat family protein n=1 Tax=Litoribrevibacter euphylliae TaxID=1834034 RepID=A0ABV7HKK8_9GAMM